MIEWDSPMISPATPGYSFYLSPSCFRKSCFEPGLKTALDSYDGNPKKGRFVAITICIDRIDQTGITSTTTPSSTHNGDSSEC